ncbi:ino80 chromatin remodeling complex protein [Phlyctema vagabunda]|uniref:Ino80 chromatin remodeling complex protein n=1 Tax=Phlyctema vagabunda TaxID=108571 RepID=A0ABR4PD58_9HELO
MNTTPAQARAIVLKAAEWNGWISQEDRDKSPPGTLTALQNAREQLGNALEIISHDLSTTNARFVLELIQNAEDNQFTRARQLGQIPYIRFNVRPTSILVECNEDGFTEENVVSISRIGRSSKSKDRGYIGEKGIGFKSVFQVATAIHIQSNSFSFSFRYGEGAARDTLGIVTPILEDELIPVNVHPLTRMTLTPFQLEEAVPYPSLVARFQRDVPDNLLLFLSTLGKIEIQCQLPDGRITLTTLRKIEKEDGKLVHLIKSVEDLHCEDNSTTEVPPDRYHITRRDIHQLSLHTSRPDIDSCEVVLAFPVDEASRPLISMQSCFAFLPIRKTNLSFIIQADFILPANREDILNTNRNIDILRGVAETFRDAVLRFVSSDSPLRYEWIKYLPCGQSLGRVWEVLPTEIIILLRTEDILYSQESPIPCQPNMLRILLPDHLDSSGLPLFSDRPGANRKYLSLQYDPADIGILRNLFELHDIEDIHMYHRIKQDLESCTSRMLGVETDSNWHSRAASLLSLILSRCSIGITNMIRELPLIPLNNGTWVNALEKELYFPAANGPEMPRDLIITVDPTAAANGFRKALFTTLGVTNILPQTVVDRLLKHYSRNGGASDLSFSKAHVSYLYWHLENRADNRLSLVWLYETHGRRITSRRSLMYFKTADEYGTHELLKAYRDPKSPGKNIPECPVSYLNPDYMTLFSSSTRRHGSSWLKWLENGLGVRRIPRIKLDGGSLSTEFRHIIRYRPDKVVGTLKKHWDDYVVDLNPPIIEALSKSEVTCLGGQLRALKDTYLPLQELRDRAQTLGIGLEFPFLQMSSDLKADFVLRGWRFLEEFEVGFEPDLKFYVEVLQQHETRTYRTWGSDTRAKILNTYELIADNCSANQKEGLCEQIDTWDLILAPCSFRENAAGPTWTDIQNCAWHGPMNLLSKEPLAEVPEYQNNRKLSKFFRETLDIDDTTWRDYLDMVSDLRNGTEPPLDLLERVLRLYQLLLSDGRSKPDWTQISERFHTEGLIYIPTTSIWVPPSKCLWDSPVPIDGKSIIHESYPTELKSFFLERLQISPASLSTLVEELITIAAQHPSVQRIKQLIWAINGMKPRPDDLDILSTCNFLPVRVSQPGVAQRIEFRTCKNDFAIVDRIKLAGIFEGKVDFLDFTLEEILHLEPFLGSLDLGESFVDNRLTADFNGKAYDLLRCAVSYRSSVAMMNAQSTLNQLRSTSILRTNGITTKYTIQWSSGNITVSIPGGYIHTTKQENGWSIYVPEDKREKVLCYSLSFPEALTKLFLVPSSAREIISIVLNKPIYILEDILDAEGIGMVRDIDPPSRSAAIDSSEEGTSEQDILDNETAVPPSLRNSQPRGTPGSSVRSPHSPPTADEIHDPPEPLGVMVANGRDYYSRDAYIYLLDHVIRLAGQTSLPHTNSMRIFGNNVLLEGFDPVIAFGVRSQGQINHDTKIGAAGELFVFEMLLALNLPRFDRSNWESTIRGLVAVHPNYTDIVNWPGRETADVTYHDQSGVLTAILIAKGYLDKKVWEDAKPKYFMEVKTTTGECSDKLYISGNQYRLMQHYAFQPGRSAPNVYIIFRVFNLGRNNLSVKLYVDPEAHRLRGDLIFESQTWTVRPRV